eukprot:CCRYP_002465-RA/>CCRYP_002465-RA protein AED:0.03 eAED:0.04 QI:0/0/0/0.83/0.6/0.5/6/0/916
MLCYRRVSCNLYSDTMFCPKVTSARGYKMVEIFASDFGWSRCYPMTRKSKAHEALGLLFAPEGFPPKMIVDGAKEMKMGEFAQKCKDAHCYLQSTEPYSPWSNSVKREIRELKKGAARKLTRGTGAMLWSTSRTSDRTPRNGRVPETIVSVETADISPFCEFGFWDWVKFRDQGVAFPGNSLVLGKYLGPSIDELARVLRQKWDANGKAGGTAHHNPALDTRFYEVHFSDGCTDELAANVIAEAVYTQCHADGNQYVFLDAIVDYRNDPSVAVAQDDQVTVVDGKKIIKRSTRDWELCCEWKDGSTSWQKLSDLKESHTLQVAEFAFAAQIADEPAFNWWVGWVLKKRDQIISLVKRRSARYHKRTHKHGIEIPKSVEEVYAIDKATDTTLVQCNRQGMPNVRVAFYILVDGAAPPPDHQFICCHMIFDARLVAGGHAAKAPATLAYASVVSRETVRIALLVAALNDVDIWAADVLNAYITAPCREKIWTTLGKEFGDDCGKKAIVVRAIYGLKSSGAAFRAHLTGCMREMGYKSCPQTLTCGSRNRQTGKGYDLLVVRHNPKCVMDRINSFLPLKPDLVGPPEMYLSAKLRKKTFEDGTMAWGLSPAKYVKQAVRNVETYLKYNLEGWYSLPKTGENPFPVDYAPEEDVTPLLEPEVATYYMQLIGILRCMCEFGRIDICTEVSMLSSYSAMPREGHLEAALHVVSYLKSKSNSGLIFDPMEPDVGGYNFVECDLSDFHPGASEALPPNAPKPLGKGVTLRMFVDSNHAGDKVSRRSRTGFVIFLNYCMIDWLSKKQSMVETSVFGTEFCAMKHGIENLRDIRYKLCMMGVPVKRASYLYGNNMSVVTNTSKPESTLKKKSNSICYHAVREAVAMGEALFAHIPTKKNLADLFTKVLYGQIRRFLVDMYQKRYVI